MCQTAREFLAARLGQADQVKNLCNKSNRLNNNGALFQGMGSKKIVAGIIDSSTFGLEWQDLHDHKEVAKEGAADFGLWPREGGKFRAVHAGGGADSSSSSSAQMHPLRSLPWCCPPCESFSRRSSLGPPPDAAGPCEEPRLS